MNSDQKIILVTGANKGIGYGIVKGLLEQSRNFKVILTSRDEERGKAAIEEILIQFPDKREFLDYHQLDIADSKSIDNCIEWIKSSYGQLDILVNNAGVSIRLYEFGTKTFDETFSTNVYGTIELTEKCLDNGLIKKHGKIVIIGSMSGQLKNLTGEKIKAEFKDPDLTLESLFNLCKKFRNSIETNSVEEDGWVKNCYSVSKMIINSYPKVVAKRKDVIDLDIQINALCPGWVRTDMGGPKAHKSLDEGAATPLYVIDLENKPEYQAKFFYEQNVKDFDA
jgi:carbonyl reductase 1